MKAGLMLDLEKTKKDERYEISLSEDILSMQLNLKDDLGFTNAFQYDQSAKETFNLISKRCRPGWGPLQSCMDMIGHVCLTPCMKNQTYGMYRKFENQKKAKGAKQKEGQSQMSQGSGDQSAGTNAGSCSQSS